jgi:hypothetical protein
MSYYHPRLGVSSIFYDSNSSKNGIQFYMDELIELEQRIHHKIAQTKDKMHKTMERVVTDRLWLEIETLNWDLMK